mmetsp:Transcript_16184/g.21438  ORF Transcript_16184/g.21438 Transcript_16184/m.21438 type:complete len:100 (-) Transcript_16184:104-403(-)
MCQFLLEAIFFIRHALASLEQIPNPKHLAKSMFLFHLLPGVATPHLFTWHIADWIFVVATLLLPPRCSRLIAAKNNNFSRLQLKHQKYGMNWGLEIQLV